MQQINSEFMDIQWKLKVLTAQIKEMDAKSVSQIQIKLLLKSVDKLDDAILSKVAPKQGEKVRNSLLKEIFLWPVAEEINSNVKVPYPQQGHGCYEHTSTIEKAGDKVREGEGFAGKINLEEL